MRPAGSWFNPQPASVKLVVEAGQVPKGSRTYTMPLVGLVIPETGSNAPGATERVVAGSSTVPTGIKRPRASARAALEALEETNSERLVKPLLRCNAVGTAIPDCVLPCTCRKP